MGAVKRNTLSVLFIIKKAKLLKNGEAPICMRITVNKRVVEVMIKRSIPVDLWNQKKECSKGKDRVATELNHYINTIRAKVLQIHRELEIDNKPITADTIKDCFYGRDKVQRSLLEVYAEHNEKCRALIGKEYTESTVTKFDTSINRLKEYIRSCYHRDDIMLAELDGQFIRDFDFWLKTDKHCQNNSALKHLKNLMLSFPFFERVPDQSIIAGTNGERYDRAVATRGNDYLLVYNYTGRPMQVDLSKISGAKKKVWWYGAKDGKLQYLGEFDSKVTTFQYDGGYISGNDQVLIAVDAGKEYVELNKLRVEN